MTFITAASVLLLGAPVPNRSKFSRDTDKLVIESLGYLLLFYLHFSILFSIGLQLISLHDINRRSATGATDRFSCRP